MMEQSAPLAAEIVKAEEVQAAETQAFTAIDAESAVQAACKAVRKCLTGYPLSAREEALLRLILARFYRERRCYASQDTLAANLGCSKTAVQTDLANLEARGLLRITRREGTSSIIQIADGVAEALGQMRAERESKRINWPRAARLKSTFEENISVVFSSPKPKKATPSKSLRDPNPYLSTSLSSSCVNEYTPSPRAREDSTEKSDGVFVKKDEEKTTETKETNQTQERGVIHVAKATTAKKEETIVVAAVSSKVEQAKALKETPESLTVALLIGEGVSAGRAKRLVQTYSLQRINANIALGLHLDADNAGGYLATAITENYAGGEVVAVKPAVKVEPPKRAAYGPAENRAAIAREREECERLHQERQERKAREAQAIAGYDPAKPFAATIAQPATEALKSPPSLPKSPVDTELSRWPAAARQGPLALAAVLPMITGRLAPEEPPVASPPPVKKGTEKAPMAPPEPPPIPEVIRVIEALSEDERAALRERAAVEAARREKVDPDRFRSPASDGNRAKVLAVMCAEVRPKDRLPRGLFEHGSHRWPWFEAAGLAGVSPDGA